MVADQSLAADQQTCSMRIWTNGDHRCRFCQTSPDAAAFHQIFVDNLVLYKNICHPCVTTGDDRFTPGPQDLVPDHLNDTLSQKMQTIIEALAKLREDLRVRKELCSQYRCVRFAAILAAGLTIVLQTCLLRHCLLLRTRNPGGHRKSPLATRLSVGC